MIWIMVEPDFVNASLLRILSAYQKLSQMEGVNVERR